jgi:hypothetical protein
MAIGLAVTTRSNRSLTLTGERDKSGGCRVILMREGIAAAFGCLYQPSVTSQPMQFGAPRFEPHDYGRSIVLPRPIDEPP